jgi:hypothetical protein
MRMHNRAMRRWQYASPVFSKIIDVCCDVDWSILHERKVILLRMFAESSTAAAGPSALGSGRTSKLCDTVRSHPGPPVGYVQRGEVLQGDYCD